MSLILFALALSSFGAASPAAPQDPAVVQTPEGVLLDFQDADLRTVIAALAEAGNLNVVYGDLPQRMVTLRMSRPVPRDNVLALLRSLAGANGLLLEEEDGLVRIEAAAADLRGGQATGPGAIQEETGPERRLHVYRLLHTRAPELAATLQSLFGGALARGTARTQARPSRERVPQGVPPVRLEDEPEVLVEVGTVRPPSLPGEVAGEVQIVPDDLTNSLLVRATDQDWEVIRPAIQALDLRPLQVMIEMMIVEVRRDRDHEVGVSFGPDSATAAERRVNTRLSGTSAGDFLLTIRNLGDVGLDVALSLLAASGNIRILSRPVIVAQNNQEARILVGSERPFVQVFRSLPTEAAIRDQIVQYRDVGTSLTIVPTINPDGYVNLSVLQEVSTATAETQFGAPIISTREAATYLFVKDGQMVVIGGLIDQQRDRTRSGIPLLKDIPVLGYLFGTTRDRLVQSELFLFLTPYIIETDEDATRIREGVEEGTELLPPTPAPLVPPWPAAPVGTDTIPPAALPPAGRGGDA